MVNARYYWFEQQVWQHLEFTTNPEITTNGSFVISFNSTYSSKYKLNSSLLKYVVLSLGEALIKTGGIESFGPPVGDARLAH